MLRSSVCWLSGVCDSIPGLRSCEIVLWMRYHGRKSSTHHNELHTVCIILHTPLQLTDSGYGRWVFEEDTLTIHNNREKDYLVATQRHRTKLDTDALCKTTTTHNTRHFLQDNVVAQSLRHLLFYILVSSLTFRY